MTQDSELTYLRDGRWAFDSGDTRASFGSSAKLASVSKAGCNPSVVGFGLAGFLLLYFRELSALFCINMNNRGCLELQIWRSVALACWLLFSPLTSFSGSLIPVRCLRSPWRPVDALTGFSYFGNCFVRSWARDQSTYRRESTTDSLRRQLQQLPDLDAALDGRRLQDLSAQRSPPAAVRGRASEIYQE